MKKYAFILSLLLWNLMSCQADQEKSTEQNNPIEETTPLHNEEPAEVSKVSLEDANIDAGVQNLPASEETSPIEKTEEDLPAPPAVPEPVPQNTDRETIKDRFQPPAGFQRFQAEEGSYEAYLQHLPLKPEGTDVTYYNGGVKPNHGVYLAVVDMEIGTRDLQQCADAVMRLRGEYLWHQQEYDQIHFNFTNGFRVDYEKWRQGYRIRFDGNKTSWVKNSSPSGSYQSFRKYMDLIFAYAGTASLEKELKSADSDDLQIGDVFIQGGFPGHAVIVVDMAVNPNGEKVFMLAQSYMPAQDIQILQNPNHQELSPWYQWPVTGSLNTPEWRFDNPRPKRF